MSETPRSPGNPYAPPDVETRTHDQGPGSGRAGLRIAGGVVAIFFGLWGVAGGGCSVVAAVTTRAIATNLTDELKHNPDASKALSAAGRVWPGMIVAGSVIAVAGVLANVVGVLFFFNRGRLLALITVGLTVVGEGMFTFMVTFNVPGVIKIVAFAFVGACALWGLRRGA